MSERKLQWTLGCGDYDRTQALINGMVQPEGIILNSVVLGPTDLFRRVAQYAEFEVAEMSVSTYLMLRSRGDDRFVGLPVFPSRLFRHGYIFVHDASGIRDPQDLIGKRVGTPEYQVTAALWLRAVMQHDYGVRPEQIRWFVGATYRPGYRERFAHEAPPGIEITVIPQHKTLVGMLEAGELDSLFGVTYPELPWGPRSSAVRRLFPDHRAVEREYFRRTGFFPIMHMVVLRRDVYERHRWTAVSLHRAFRQAKEIGQRRLAFTAAPACSIPWLQDELEEMHAVMGPDPWAYGLGPNRQILEAMVQYSVEQGLARRRLELEELFAAETWDE